MLTRKPRKGTPHKISSPGAELKSCDTIIPTLSSVDESTSSADLPLSGGRCGSASPPKLDQLNSIGMKKENDHSDRASPILKQSPIDKKHSVPLDLTAKDSNDKLGLNHVENGSQTLFLFGSKYEIHKLQDGQWALKNELDLLNVLESFLSQRKSEKSVSDSLSQSNVVEKNGTVSS